MGIGINKHYFVLLPDSWSKELMCESFPNAKLDSNVYLGVRLPQKEIIEWTEVYHIGSRQRRCIVHQRMAECGLGNLNSSGWTWHLHRTTEERRKDLQGMNIIMGRTNDDVSERIASLVVFVKILRKFSIPQKVSTTGTSEPSPFI